VFDPLADHTKRLDWADEDGSALQTEIQAFVKSQPYAVFSEFHGNEGTATLRRNIDPAAEAKVLDRCARLIGSYLDNSRAALNYATYILALLDKPAHPELKPESVELPIFNDRALYRKHNRVKKLSDEHRAAIEAVQPYDGERPGLWLLHELARSYRHRLIHPTTLETIAAEHTVHVTNGTLESMEVLYAGVAQYDKPVLCYTVQPTGEGEVHGHPNVALSVCIDHALCRGLESVGVLNQIARDASKATSALAELIPVYPRLGPDGGAHRAPPTS
jgi:hypothetical protein